MSERGRGRPPRRGGGGRGGARGGHQPSHNQNGHHGQGAPQSPHPAQAPQGKKQIEERQQALKKEQAEAAAKSAEGATEAELAKPLEKAYRYVKGELNEVKAVKALGPSWLPQRPPLPPFQPEDNPREGYRYTQRSFLLHGLSVDLSLASSCCATTLHYLALSFHALRAHLYSLVTRISSTLPTADTPRSQTLLEEQRADPFYAVWADALAALLASPYHVFWSCIVYDESLRRFLDSFLRLFVRPSEPAFAIVLRNARRKRVFEDVMRVYWRAGQRTEARAQGPALHMEAAYYNKLIAEVRGGPHFYSRTVLQRYSRTH